MRITFLEYQGLLFGYDFFLGKEQIFRWELYYLRVDAEKLLTGKTEFNKVKRKPYVAI